MASRIIHLAVMNRLLKTYTFKDENRLLLGSVLPDAAISGNSHLRIFTDGGTKKTFDLTRFRTEFLSQMREDDLYIGYYLHLVQDLFFRDFVYRRYQWDPSPPGNIERLHNDYALINRYIIRKYAISDNLTIPACFDLEPLNRLGVFAVVPFLSNMKNDFTCCPSGEIFFFSEEMADAYIAYAGEQCKREFEAFLSGISCIDERMLAWERR